MEKRGAICCPKCHSAHIEETGHEKIAIKYDPLKISVNNTGGRFLCRMCGHSFNQVTNDLQADESADA